MIILFTRLLIYLKYNLNYIDTDQVYVWAGALDYSKGLFYEPRFYGQDYNTFMEGLFAVPLVWLKVKPYYAVPLASHFISLFPYFFTALYLFFHNHRGKALLVLTIVVCLPIENDLLNAIPRGFVTGLFFCSFFIINMLNPYRLNFFILNTCLAILGYFVNPNSALVSVPFFCYVFLHHTNNKSVYLSLLIPAALIYPMHYFFDHFYQIHPDYVLHPLEYQFSIKTYFWDNLIHLDDRFCHVSFFSANKAYAILISFLILFVFTFKKNKKAFYSLLVFVFVLFFSFCFGKTTEGSTWVFGSYSRMYLALPFLVAIYFSTLDFKWPPISALCLLLPLFFGSSKILTMDTQLQSHLSNRGGVSVIPHKTILDLIDFYKKACQNTNSSFLLVSSHFWANTILSCGAKTMDDNFPDCSETFAEKRYWTREKNNGFYPDHFVLAASDYHLDEKLNTNPAFKINKLDGFGLFYISNNTLSMKQFIELVNKTDQTF